MEGRGEAWPGRRENKERKRRDNGLRVKKGRRKMSGKEKRQGGTNKRVRRKRERRRRGRKEGKE